MDYTPSYKIVSSDRPRRSVRERVEQQRLEGDFNGFKKEYERPEKEAQERAAADRRIREAIRKLDMAHQCVEASREQLGESYDPRLGEYERYQEPDVEGLSKQDAQVILARNALLARQGAADFAASESRYYICPENFETLVAFMLQNYMQPTCENFQKAFNVLYEDGLMKHRPDRKARTPVSEPSTEELQTVAEQVLRAARSKIDSEEKEREYTDAEINAMDSKTYREKILKTSSPASLLFPVNSENRGTGTR